jgi:hypothetical protein
MRFTPTRLLAAFLLFCAMPAFATTYYIRADGAQNRQQRAIPVA